MEAEESEKRGRPGNTCHVDDVWWTRGGRRGSESEFLTGEVKYCRSRERLGSGLSLECSMMKSSTLFECGPLPPTPTSRPPDVIHVTGVPRPSPFFALFRLHVLY